MNVLDGQVEVGGLLLNLGLEGESKIGTLRVPLDLILSVKDK